MITSIYYTTNVYPYQPTYWVFNYTQLFLLVTTSENPFFYENFLYLCKSVLLVRIFLNLFFLSVKISFFSVKKNIFFIYANLWESLLLSAFMFKNAFFEVTIVLIFWFMAADLRGCSFMLSWLLINVAAALCFLLKSSSQAKFFQFWHI